MHAFAFYGAAFIRWLREQNERKAVRWERVKPGGEQILPNRVSSASWTRYLAGLTASSGADDLTIETRPR